MEEIINLVIQNGLGVASFIVLVYFMDTSLKNMEKTMGDIGTTLVQIQLNLSQLNERVDNLEEDKYVKQRGIETNQ